MTQTNNKLTPAKDTHLKNKEGQIFEGEIWLGCFDSKDNYTEASEEEYQEYLKSLELHTKEVAEDEI